MKIKFIENLLNLIFPHICPVCNENSIPSNQHICSSCVSGIPRTNYHKIADNPVEKRFWGKVDLYKATSFFHFHKGSMYRVLLHELKYRNNRQIGEYLGALAASEMTGTWLDTVDIIIPVPLHQRKLAQRGYNQSELIANGLQQILTQAVCRTDLINRNKENTTQTRKNVFQRYQNTAGIFSFNKDVDVSGKHILIVDDVLTTGSTIEACVACVPYFSGLKISVFTLAVA